MKYQTFIKQAQTYVHDVHGLNVVDEKTQNNSNKILQKTTQAKLKKTEKKSSFGMSFFGHPEINNSWDTNDEVRPL